MAFETFVRCLDKVPPRETVVFSGMAEPWLNPDCTRMLEYAVGRGHAVEVFTTLVGMSESDYAALKAASPRVLCLHVPDAEGNARFPADDGFRRILDLALDDVLSGALRVTSFSCHGQVRPDLRERIGRSGVPVIDEMHDRAGNLEDPAARHERRRVRGSAVCTRCRGTSLNNNLLLPDGTVVLCCMDYGLRHPLGNLLHDGYAEVTDGPAKRRCREMLASERAGEIICRRCISCKPAWQWRLYRIPLVRLLCGRRA